MLTVLAGLAEYEREVMLERQADGITVAQKNVIHCGRPKTDYPDNWESIVDRLQDQELVTYEAVKLSGLSRSIFFRLQKKWKEQK